MPVNLPGPGSGLHTLPRTDREAGGIGGDQTECDDRLAVRSARIDRSYVGGYYTTRVQAAYWDTEEK